MQCQRVEIVYIDGIQAIHSREILSVQGETVVCARFVSVAHVSYHLLDCSSLSQARDFIWFYILIIYGVYGVYIRIR